MKVNTNKRKSELHKQKCCEVHNNKYDYSLWPDDVKITEKIVVPIVCPIHGIFQQRVSDHKQGCGCKLCGKIKQTESKRCTKNHFISLCKNHHKNYYDYKLINDNVSRHDIVEIICPVHGIFQQRLNSHINGHGCKQCASDQNSEYFSAGLQHFIEISNIKHHFKYDYSLISENVRSTDVVSIICPIHGTFTQIMNSHTQGRGCNKCKLSLMRATMFQRYGIYNAHQYNTDENTLQILENPTWLIQQHHENKKPITVIAKDVGVHPIVIRNRLRRFGIQVIYYFKSVGEGQICDLIDEIGIEYIGNTREIIPPYEIDVYIPQLKLAIEYCGIYWHSERQGKHKNYHKTKLDMCNHRGIQLLTIFEDEWTIKRQQIIDHISNICIPTQDTIDTSVCDIIEIENHEAVDFINNFSIHQYVYSEINYGLVYEDNIVGCICLNKINDTECYKILNVYVFDCISNGITCLIDHFIANYKCKYLVLDVDLRWYTPSKFTDLGFIVDKNVEPDYTLSIGNNVCTNKDEFLSNLPKYLKNYDNTLSDEQNSENHNVLRIWDCGHAVLRKTIDISKHPA